jgi:hypothetical protein
LPATPAEPLPAWLMPPALWPVQPTTRLTLPTAWLVHFPARLDELSVRLAHPTARLDDLSAPINHPAAWFSAKNTPRMAKTASFPHPAAPTAQKATVWQPGQVGRVTPCAPLTPEACQTRKACHARGGQRTARPAFSLLSRISQSKPQLKTTHES